MSGLQSAVETAQIEMTSGSVCQPLAQPTERPSRDRLRIYRVWRVMIDRCHNAKSRTFSGYGGRGIYVCDRWRTSFEVFVADMGVPPIGFTIERVNNDGPYSPQNCRWATTREQQQNKRSTICVTLNGRTLSFPDMARRYRLDATLVRSRLLRGWSLEDAFTTPPIPRRGRKRGVSLRASATRPKQSNLFA